MPTSLPNVLLAIALLLVVVSGVQPLARRLVLSDAVLLAVVGTLIGVGAVMLLESPHIMAFDGVARTVLSIPINAQAFLFIFLPLLVYEGALAIDVRRLARDAAPVLMLAVVAVLVTTAATGAALFPLAGVPLDACLLLGAIVATTDPSAVVGVFRSIGADGRLTRLVEGESLLNDAAAIAVFTILLRGMTEHVHTGPVAAAALLFGSFGGGLLVGFVLARLVLLVVPLLGGLRAAEATLTLALPYVAYIACDEFVGASGVVAAAAAGLTVSAIGPSTFRPGSWTFLTELWGQLAFWASSMVFILASILVPKLLVGITRWDLVLLAVLVVSTFAARALVLFGLLPVLTALRLSQRVPRRFKVTMLWGALRGAITLALALAVTENPAVSSEVQHLVAILATGFVLVTLLACGTTLRLVVRFLRLDRLSPIDQALRNQVVAIGLGEVRDRLRETAGELGFAAPVSGRVMERYDRRISAEREANEFEAAVTDRDRVVLGLITLASQEHSVLLEMFKDRALPRAIMEHLLWTAESMVDGARSEGRLGYIRAARGRLRPGLRFRLAHWLHRRFHWDRPLMNAMAERFEMLLLMRLVAVSLQGFLRRRMEPVLGRRVTEIVADVAERRRDLMDGAMDTLRFQYPGYAEALELRVLQQIGLRMESDEYAGLLSESLIGPELHEELVRGLEERRDAIARPLRFSLQSGLDNRVREIPLLAGLQDAVLHDVAMSLTIRFAVPGETILRRGRRARSVFFVSSGAVEQGGSDGVTMRLGPGEFLGAAEVLAHARHASTVRSAGFSHLLELRGGEFRRLLEDNPELAARMEALLAARGAPRLEASEPAGLLRLETPQPVATSLVVREADPVRRPDA